MENSINFNSYVSMLSKLHDDKTCRQYLEKVLWNDKPNCPHCKNEKYYRLKNGVLYRCSDCRKNYTVTIGTIFEGSHIPLRKWMIAIFIFSSHKRGISSHQLAKDIDITQKSAWFLLGRLRLVFEPQYYKGKMNGIVSCDELLVGGIEGNKHKNKRTPKNQGRSNKTKTTVFGIMNDDQITTRIIPNVKGETLRPIITELVQASSIVVTDDWGGYRGLRKTFKHKVVKHKKGEYVTTDGYSSNNVENFWSHLSRGLYGTYFHCQPKHLHRYCREFEFRMNTRKQSEVDRFDEALRKSKNLKLSYKKLIEN